MNLIPTGRDLVTELVLQCWVVDLDGLAAT